MRVEGGRGGGLGVVLGVGGAVEWFVGDWCVVGLVVVTGNIRLLIGIGLGNEVS